MLVRRAHLKDGEDVLVMGAGSGVGTAAIQIAKLFHARVIAVAGTDDKLAKAAELGADAGINYATQDLAQEVRRLTGKRGVDVVFEHVGGTTWEKLIPNIAAGGRLVTCGATAGYDSKVDIRFLFSKSIAILGAFMGCKADLLEVVRHMAEGRLRPVVDRTLPLVGVRPGPSADRGPGRLREDRPDTLNSMRNADCGMRNDTPLGCWEAGRLARSANFGVRNPCKGRNAKCRMRNRRTFRVYPNAEWKAQNSAFCIRHRIPHSGAQTPDVCGQMPHSPEAEAGREGQRRRGDPERRGQSHPVRGRAHDRR